MGFIGNNKGAACFVMAKLTKWKFYLQMTME
jgi:hypothetical protein